MPRWLCRQILQRSRRGPVPSQRSTSPVHFSASQVADTDLLGEAPVTKVRRNKPCPCGSGKKYESCHGRLA
ncbi:MAG: SEC-C domain-containing protein [Betaproteobacteria bacterium]|nr:SEC-C domain-containing protein [Betaproteobacteria bacterium]